MRLSYGFVSYMIVGALALPAAAFRAYVLARCWLWFVVPLGLPVLSMAHAYGLACLTLLMTYMPPFTKDDDVKQMADSISRDASGREKFTWAWMQVMKMVAPTLATWPVAAIAHEVMAP